MTLEEQDRVARQFLPEGGPVPSDAPPRDTALTDGGRSAATHLSALVGYFVATLIFTWPLARNLTTAIPGDSFDGWQNYWNQWWIKVALVEGLTWPLHTDILYAPTGVNLYFHTLNPFNGLATLPIQLTGGLIAAYNAVVFLSWVLAGYGMFLLAKWVLRGRDAARYVPPAAFLAGLVYTLSPFHMAHLLGHMQVMSLQWIPFYVLYLLRAIQQSQGELHPTPHSVQAPAQPWLRSSLLAGLFLVLNGLCDWYFVLYLLLFTGLVVAWQWGAALWTLRSGDRSGSVLRSAMASLWRVVRPPLVAGIVFAVGLSFWLVPMVLEAQAFRFMVRPPADLYILSASVMDFFVPNRLHTLFRPGSFTWIGNQIAPISERTISIGYVALGLALVAVGGALRTARSRGSRQEAGAAFWAAAALFFFLLALGPQWQWGNITFESIPPAVMAGEEVPSYTPYGLLNELVPFMRISRSVSRFALMVQVCASVLAAMGLYSVLRAVAGHQGGGAQAVRQPDAQGPNRLRAPRLAYGVTAAAIVLLLGEYWVAPYPLSPPDTPAYYEQLAADPDPRAVLNLPMNYDRPGYLLYQTVHRKPLTVAYISRDDPRTLTERTPLLQHFRHLDDDIIAGDPAAVAPAVLADLGVGTVVLDRYKMPGGLEREYTEALAQRVFAGQAPVYEDERITVYRVPDPASAPPDDAGTAGGAAARPYLRLGPRNWGPRTVNADGKPQRALTGGAAVVEVLHAKTPVEVTIRYRTQGEGAGMRVLAQAGDAGEQTLPPAPAGNEVTFTVFPPVATAGVLGPAGLLLEPLAAGTVYIEQLRLEE